MTDAHMPRKVRIDAAVRDVLARRMTMRAAARTHGTTVQTIRRRLDRQIGREARLALGHELRTQPRPSRRPDVRAACDAVLSGECSLGTAAARYGVSRTAIRDRLDREVGREERLRATTELARRYTGTGDNRLIDGPLRARWREAYESGASVAEIARREGQEYMRVYSTLHRDGVLKKSPQRRVYAAGLVRELHRWGWSVRQIADIARVSEQRVRALLLEGHSTTGEQI